MPAEIPVLSLFLEEKIVDVDEKISMFLIRKENYQIVRFRFAKDISWVDRARSIFYSVKKMVDEQNIQLQNEDVFFLSPENPQPFVFHTKMKEFQDANIPAIKNSPFSNEIVAEFITFVNKQKIEKKSYLELEISRGDKINFNEELLLKFNQEVSPVNIENLSNDGKHSLLFYFQEISLEMDIRTKFLLISSQSVIILPKVEEFREILGLAEEPWMKISLILLFLFGIDIEELPGVTENTLQTYVSGNWPNQTRWEFIQLFDQASGLELLNELKILSHRHFTVWGNTVLFQQHLRQFSLRTGKRKILQVLKGRIESIVHLKYLVILHYVYYGKSYRQAANVYGLSRGFVHSLRDRVFFELVPMGYF